MQVEPTAAVRVEFEGLTAAEGNRAAAELQAAIEQVVRGRAEVSVVKEREDTQDFGATLLLVLGTEVAIIVAKAIYTYVAKRGDSVVIKTNGGEVIARGSAASNIDVAKTAEALRSSIGAP
ncbi:hypothetical protein JNUCC0626_27160 [Lentzea sp. JNUCC 0626]|uniref:hypothetical protein n=1 Tax=Lentzea sp. JNUCC 0626 TaxID=3367513 RepID=UPI0037495DE8